MSCLFRGILILIAFSLSSSGQTPDLTITPFPQTSLYPGSDVNGLQIARASNGNYILITESRIELIPRQYGYTSMDWDEIADSNLPSSWTGSNFRHTGNYLVTANNILGQEVMGVIDGGGGVIIPLVHSNLTNPAEETTGYRIATVSATDGQRQGVIAQDGRWVIHPKYDSLGAPNANGTRSATSNGKNGTVDRFRVWKENPPSDPPPDWTVQPWPTNNVEILDISIGPTYTNTFGGVVIKQTSTSLYPGYDTNGLSIATHNGFQKTVLSNSSGAIIPPQYGFNSVTLALITDSNLPVRTDYIFPSTNDWPRAWNPTNQKHTGEYLVTATTLLGRNVMGVLDGGGNVIIPLVYDNLSDPAEENTGYRIATVTNKDGQQRQGVVAPHAPWYTWVIPPYFDFISPPDPDGNRNVVVTREDSTFVPGGITTGLNGGINLFLSGGGFFNSPDPPQSIPSTGAHLVSPPASVWKMGLIDPQGRTILDYVYDHFASTPEPDTGYRVARVTTKHPVTDQLILKRGVIDSLGNFVIPAYYDSLNLPEPTGHRIASILTDNIILKYGLIDAQGNTAIDFLFDSLGSPEASGNRIASILDDDNASRTRYGVIDARGTTVIDFLYNSLDSAEASGNRIASVLNDNNVDKFGVIDAQGTTIIKFLYDSLGAANADGNRQAAKTRTDFLPGGITTEGSVTIQQFMSGTGSLTTQITSIGDHLVPKPEPIWKMGLLDPGGTVILPLVFDHLPSAPEPDTGYRVARVTQIHQVTGQLILRRGVINQFENWVIPPYYDTLGPVNIDGDWPATYQSPYTGEIFSSIISD